MTQSFNLSQLDSDAAVDLARVAYTLSRERYSNRKVLCAFLCSFVVFALIVGVVVLPTWIGMALVLPVGVLASVALVTGKFAEQNERETDERLEALQPLSETTKCVEALELCRRSKPAQLIRERVLSSGRQLYAFDYDEMLEQTERERSDNQKAAQLAACKELHEIV